MSKTLTGRVVSDKNDQTIVINVATRKTHPVYKKQYTVNKKFMAHDQKNEAKVGDLVLIREARPLSARKRFELDKIVEKALVGFVETDATADVPQEPKKEEQVANSKKQASATKTKKSSPKETEI